METSNVHADQSKREGFGKCGRNFHELSENRCGLDSEMMQLSYLVLVLAFPILVLAIINCHGIGGFVS